MTQGVPGEDEMTSRAGQALAAAIGEVGDGLSPEAWDVLADPDAAIAAIEKEVRDDIRARLEGPVRALHRWDCGRPASEFNEPLAEIVRTLAISSSSATETQDGERPDPARAFAYWFAAQPFGIQRQFVHDWIDRHEPEPGLPYNESPQPTPTPDDRDREVERIAGGHKMTGADLIAIERQRQIAEEGYGPEHDAEHNSDEDLAHAGAAYALADEWRGSDEGTQSAPPVWPWSPAAWKPTPDNRIRELVKAGALIAAAIDAGLRASGGTE